MKMHMLLRKMYSWRIALFALTIIFTSIIVPLSGLNSSTANAANTLQQCYDKYNNKDVSNTQLPNDCQNLGCQYNKPIQGKISCPDPNALPDSAVKAAADAAVKPLQTLVCGPIPSNEALLSVYTDCAAKVRTAYTTCDTVVIPIQGPVPDTDANTAKCIRDRLANPKPVLADIVNAVHTGRAAAKGITDEARNAIEDQKKKAQCEADGGTWANSKCSTDNEDKSTCNVDSIGWIVCPVVNFMSTIVDASYSVVSAFLTVQPLETNNPNSGIYKAWSIMRNFSNVAFVIAFLVIIFSQVTSIGVSNYGIKKLLPKIIIAAILVNLSYWICAVAVDLSNIVGSSVNSLFKGISDQMALPDLGNTSSGAGGVAKWAGIAAVVLVSAGIVLYTTLSALLPALVIAGVTILTVFLILVVRQVLIILLIVVSPLAFVAFLLPNTESLFKKWRSLFTGLLIIYPVIGLLFGAGGLASAIIMNSATGDYKMLWQTAGAAASIAPLVLLMAVLKAFTGVAGKVGAWANNPNKGPFDKLRKRAEGNRDYRQGIAQTRRIGRAEKFLNRGGPLAAGEKRSKGRRIGAWVAGAGATYGVNTEQREANAKRALTEEKQGYVAGRASTEAAYAKSVASPTGDVEAVVASAQDAVRHEYLENVNRIKAQYASSGKTGDEVLAEIVADQGANGAKKMSSAQLGAAIQHVTDNGRAQAQQNLVDFMGQLGTERAGLDPTSARAGLLKDAQQMAASGLAGSKVKPKSLAASEIAKMNAGGFTKDMDQLMNTYLNEGKMSKEKVVNMDIDEIMHLQNMVQQGRVTLDPATQQAVKASIDELIGQPDPADPNKRVNADPILVTKLEPRQINSLDDIKNRL
jgi:hypothetical protein